VGQARVAGLEQEPGGDVVGVGGQRAGAAGGWQFGVPAALVVLAGLLTGASPESSAAPPDLTGLTGALLVSRGGRLRFILLPRRQAQPAVQELVPFRWVVVAAFPGADHPDQAVVLGDRLAAARRGGAVVPARARPSRGSWPFAQLADDIRGHHRYLRIAIAPAAR
jgi:hypothetical protein